MMQKQWQLYALAIGVVSVWVGQPGLAESTSDRSRPATTVKEWMAQVEAATVQITNVQLNRTDTGLEIVLETAGKPLQIDVTKFRTEGNSLIAEISNTVLALPQGQLFSAETPTTDIANVQVVQQDAGGIRISVTGNNALPKTEVTLKTGELAYSLNPEADEPDEEIVVTGERSGYRVPNSSTATKTDTPLRDIPQVIQVIPQQLIRDQNITKLQDAIVNVPGVNVFTPSYFPTANVSFRGFVSGGLSGNYLRDGLRNPIQTTNDTKSKNACDR
ncbi:AMIN domain-containing protein [Myxacorys almedinensis]|uniref:AMIN domain-containing protein n=1 Tax=Myxacorys almedinensis A TaxID=2690445 RepID=A0A8J7Z753_9CYAN|nr:TonB-dependent receptor plug domain-containing protein [Myxacorys almedinensis]NDJ19283.1 AMIN domain-containing protein [Myxacorys almedinensis A]